MERAKFGIPKSQMTQKIPERQSLGNSKSGPMLEEEISRDAQTAIRVYGELYEKRYGSLPVFRNPAQATEAMKIGLRNIRPQGLPRFLSMLKEYLKMNNPYFIERKHVLDVFLKNIQEISAATVPEKQVSKAEAFLNVDTQCPVCDAWFMLTCKSNDIESKVLLTPCDKCTLAGSKYDTEKHPTAPQRATWNGKP